MRRKSVCFAAVLAAIAALTAPPVRAAHNTITVANPTVVFKGRRTWGVTSQVSVRNLVPRDQSGPLTVVVFRVESDGRVVEVERRSLGIIDVAASASVSVPFSLELHAIGSFVILADYSSSVGGNPVPHTHSGTISFVIN